MHICFWVSQPQACSNSNEANIDIMVISGTFIFKFYLFIYLFWLCCTARRILVPMWDLSSLTRDWTLPNVFQLHHSFVKLSILPYFIGEEICRLEKWRGWAKTTQLYGKMVPAQSFSTLMTQWYHPKDWQKCQVIPRPHSLSPDILGESQAQTLEYPEAILTCNQWWEPWLMHFHCLSHWMEAGLLSVLMHLLLSELWRQMY